MTADLKTVVCAGVRLSEIPQLNSCLFTEELHEWNHFRYYDNHGDHIILGWCPGEMVPYRPCLGEYALMFETEDGEKYWCHFVGGIVTDESIDVSY